MKNRRIVRIRFIDGTYYMGVLKINEYYTLICLMEMTDLEKEIKSYKVFKH